MGLLNKIMGRETRAETTTSSDTYLAEFFNQRGNQQGYVDPDRASGLSVAHACITTIATSLASVPLPLHVRKEDGGREKATSHPLYSVLHDMFNPQMTAFEGREFMTASLLSTGNAYARIEMNGRGQVVALYPLDPTAVTVERLANGRLRYSVNNRSGAQTVLLQDDVLHLRWRLARDGVMGLSPIQLARETFNLALCQQDQTAKQARNAFRPEGALVFQQSINSDKKGEALTKLGARIESQASTSGILVLDGGLDWKSFSMSAKDAEFLESRKLTNLDICRVFGIPPTVAGITDNATYSNVDGESRALVVRCLAPMARRIEQAMNAALLGAISRKTMFIEHDLAGLMRGDLKARYEAYRIGREGGWLSSNEIRAFENLSSIEGGDGYLTPLNMAKLGENDDG
ncbi:MAG: phage portal protein [Rhodobacteraceae bacterium]|nr:phage portal protein [Paracoccaceae bacterium]